MGDDELKVEVGAGDLGYLMTCAVRYALPYPKYAASKTGAVVRRYWAQIPAYYQRQIICQVEVELLLSKRGDDGPKIDREEWEAFVRDLRPPKTPYTVDYRCSKCEADGLKLWRGVHGAKNKDGHELLCAACLVPDKDVGEDGKILERGDSGVRTDQIAGWLPAVPTGDTFWGYSSVPSADVEWWAARPTYASKP